MTRRQHYEPGGVVVTDSPHRWVVEKQQHLFHVPRIHSVAPLADRFTPAFASRNEAEPVAVKPPVQKQRVVDLHGELAKAAVAYVQRFGAFGRVRH